MRRTHRCHAPVKRPPMSSRLQLNTGKAAVALLSAATCSGRVWRVCHDCGTKRGDRGSHSLGFVKDGDYGECEGCYFLRSDCWCPTGGSARRFPKD